jgi:hypothetical protein
LAAAAGTVFAISLPQYGKANHHEVADNRDVIASGHD